MADAAAGGLDQVSQLAVIAFYEAINRRDLDSLEKLMTDGHTFVDSDGDVLAGRGKVLQAWRGFFDLFPDYRNEWSNVMEAGDTLIAAGRSACATEAALDGPAIWTARTAGGKVCERHVYEDTPVTRDELGIAWERLE